MQDTLKILESVNQFYSQSFNQLVVITVAVLAFAGVMMPILISLYQKRIFKLEREAIEDSLKKTLQKDMDECIERMRNEYKEKEDQYEARISKLDQKMERTISGATAASLHIQGNISIGDKQYLRAFESLTSAATNYIKADSESNLRRVLRIIIEKCLPNLKKEQLENDENTIADYDDFLAKLEEYNINRRYYADDLRRKFRSC